MNTLKAISMWQPWASLWALQLKLNETRSWKHSWDGPIAVHATKTTPLEEYECIRKEPFRTTLREAKAAGARILERGCIIAVCESVICRPVETALAELRPEQKFLETAFGNFAKGRFAWRAVNMRVLKEPVYCSGHQTLWDVPPDIALQVYAQLTA